MVVGGTGGIVRSAIETVACRFREKLCDVLVMVPSPGAAVA